MTVDWIQKLGTPFWDERVVEGVRGAIVFAVALAVSLMLTPVFRGIARKLGMVDQPGERRINKTPIPRGGGVSVFIAFHLTLLLLVRLDGAISKEFDIPWQYAFLAGSSALVVIGFIDDKFGLKPIYKLLGQVAVASFLFACGIRINSLLFALPVWLNYVVTVFWIVGAVNAFNLIDGMDGLASGLTLIASLGLAGSLFFTGLLDNMLPYFALAGACLGFLRYNFHPATVFLGDAGSMFLGLCVATLPLVSGSRLELIPSLIVPLLAMGVPIFDTLLAIWRRTIRAHLLKSTGEVQPGQQTRVMQADRDHVHHRVLRVVNNQKAAVWVFYAASAALMAVGLLATLLRRRAPGIFLMAFFVAVAVIVRHLARIELWDTGRLLSNRRIAIRKGLVTPLYVVSDLLSLGLAWALAHWALYGAFPRRLFVTNMPLYVGAVFTSLVFAKTYRRVWQRAQFSDFSLLVGAAVVGVFAGTGLTEIIYDNINEDLLRISLVLAAFSLPPLMCSRFAGETLRGVMQTLKRQTLLQNAQVERLLVYGAGLRFRNYMREQTLRLAVADRVIVGIIDDDIQFAGRIIYGYNVLGVLHDIPVICAKNRIDRVIITCLLPEDIQAALLRMAAEHRFKVSLWVNEERDLT